MKKSIPILLAVLLCLCTQTFAQNRADELMKQAQENLQRKNTSRHAISFYRLTMPSPRKKTMPRL